MTSDGADLAALVAGFAARLRASGAAVDVRGARHCAAALGRLGPGAERRQVYWAARVTLVHRAEELDVFDRVFAEIFGPSAEEGSSPVATPALSLPGADQRPAHGADAAVETDAELPWATRPRQLVATSGEQVPDSATAVPVVTASRRRPRSARPAGRQSSPNPQARTRTSNGWDNSPSRSEPEPP